MGGGNALEGHYPAYNWTFSERSKNVPSTFCGCSVKMLKKQLFDVNKTSQMDVYKAFFKRFKTFKNLKLTYGRLKTFQKYYERSVDVLLTSRKPFKNLWNVLKTF